MDQHSAPQVPGRRGAALPRLDIRGPVLFGTIVALLFFGAGLGGAALLPIDKGVGFSGALIVETKVKAVQHPRGGVVDQILVAEGRDVKAGDVLITLDASALDEQITALKLQSQAADRQLDLIRQEAQTMNDLLDRNLATRSRVLALERQVAEVEKEIAGLRARIVMAQQELVRSEIRAPSAGRLLSLAVSGPGAVIQPGQTVAEIVPQDDRLVLEGRLSPIQIETVKSGMSARVWLRTLSWRDSRPLKARLAWVSPDTIDDKRTGTPYFIARVELEETRAEVAKRIALHPGMRAELLLLTGERTLLEQLLDPLMRNINRAFRA